MNWMTFRTLAMANLRSVFLGIGIILLLGFIFFGGSSSNSDVPSVDFGALIISAALFWFANKVGTSSIGGKVIGTIAIIILIAGTYPIINYALDKVGLSPNFILVLAALMGIWVWKKGNGFFFWRLGLFLCLLAAAIGARGAEIKDGLNAFLASTGIEFKMPAVEMPEAVKDTAKGFSKYIKNYSAQKISQSKERLVKNGSTFYTYDGTSFTKKDFPFKEEFIKVFILDEQVTKDGLAYNKVRIGDPATGEVAWVYSGILLKSPAISAPKPDPTGKSSDWEKVEEKVVDFSRVNVICITPEKYIATILLPIKMESGNYKIKVQGNYEFYLGGRWINFPWQGNDRLVAFPNKKEYSEMQNGAIVILKGNENITPTSADGAMMSLSGKIDNLTLKINTFFKYGGEYLHPQGGFILRNSSDKPLTVIIEKEVKS